MPIGRWVSVVVANLDERFNDWLRLVIDGAIRAMGVFRQPDDKVILLQCEKFRFCLEVGKQNERLEI